MALIVLSFLMDVRRSEPTLINVCGSNFFVRSLSKFNLTNLWGGRCRKVAERHAPMRIISLSVRPAAASVDAPPIRREWVDMRVESIPK